MGSDARKPLVLVGFMASGKSTVGPLLAKRLAIPFIDTDRLIAERFGMSIATVFRDKGEAAFRTTERELILDLLPGDRRVIAAGGGAFIDPTTRSALATLARTIWLDPPFEVIRTRLEQCSDRPIAETSDAAQLRALWTGRRPFYAEADLHIQGTRDDAASTVEQILAALPLSSRSPPIRS